MCTLESYHLYTKPCNMRKGFINTLAGLAKNELGRNSLMERYMFFLSLHPILLSFCTGRLEGLYFITKR